MSRGPGHVECAIARLFTDNPDAAFTITDLAAVVYPVPHRAFVEKRHRVTVGRAAKRVAERQWWHAIGGQRNSLVYHNKLSLLSYRTALRAGWSPHPIIPGETWWQASARRAEQDYQSDAEFRSHCDRSIAASQAEHDGQLEEAVAIRAEMQQARKAQMAVLMRMA